MFVHVVQDIYNSDLRSLSSRIGIAIAMSIAVQVREAVEEALVIAMYLTSMWLLPKPHHNQRLLYTGLAVPIVLLWTLCTIAVARMVMVIGQWIRKTNMYTQQQPYLLVASLLIVYIVVLNAVYNPEHPDSFLIVTPFASLGTTLILKGYYALVDRFES